MKDESGTQPPDLRSRTKAFALRIIKLSSALRSGLEIDVIRRQVVRSGTSVGANYREAHRARSNAEFVSKIGDCLRELDETNYWLELLIEAEIVSSERLSSLVDEPNQLIAILTVIVRKVKSSLNDRCRS